MSWDLSPPKPPFYRRTWFLVLVALVLIVVGGAVILLLDQKTSYERRAREFDYSKLKEMESASVIYDRNNQVLGRIFIQNRDEVSLEELSPNLLKAVVGAEDARFYQHDGVDYFGVLRAVVRNYQAGRTRQGASTLTQQLARNTFPEELPPSDRTKGRKFLEMAVAREIENRFTKQQIIVLYLNRVFFGAGFYGAEAAARGYFGKRAKDLNLSESAVLAGLLRSPNNLSPWRNRAACLEQRNYVLSRMLELKLISQAEHDQAKQDELLVRNRRPVHQESYAAEMVEQQVNKLLGLEEATSEGYRIYTTIDATLQKKAEAALRDQLAIAERHKDFDHVETFGRFDQTIRAYRRKYAAQGEDAGPPPEPAYLQGAVVVLDNETGAILAMVGGRDFTHSPYNRATMAKRPVGTAFKPFVYAAAFERGLFPGTAVQDAVIDNRQVMIGGTTGILGEWGPERADNKYQGTISAREALVNSKNAATVRLGMMIGGNPMTAQVAALAKNAGISSEVRPFPSSFLGSSEMTLLEMTLANTMFPKGGVRPEKAFVITRIEDKSGKTIFGETPKQKRVIRPTTAFEVHSCLAEALERGTGARAFGELGLKRVDLGGKTGTAYNFTDAWFIGYSSEITCGVWAGFDKPRTPIYRGAFSNVIALPVWTKVMAESFATYRPQRIAEPAGLVRCQICSASGLLGTDKCFELLENKETGEKLPRTTVYTEIATDAQAPRDTCDIHGDTPRTFTRAEPQSGGSGKFPRAQLATDLAANTPVVLKAPTVVGEDPYNSISTQAQVADMRALQGQVAPLDNSGKAAPTTEQPKEVRRAEPVKPMDQTPVVDGPIKLEAPKPIEF